MYKDADLLFLIHFFNINLPDDFPAERFRVSSCQKVLVPLWSVVTTCLALQHGLQWNWFRERNNMANLAKFGFQVDFVRDKGTNSEYGTKCGSSRRVVW